MIMSMYDSVHAIHHTRSTGLVKAVFGTDSSVGPHRLAGRCIRSKAETEGCTKSKFVQSDQV